MKTGPENKITAERKKMYLSGREAAEVSQKGHPRGAYFRSESVHASLYRYLYLYSVGDTDFFLMEEQID